MVGRTELRARAANARVDDCTQTTGAVLLNVRASSRLSGWRSRGHRGRAGGDERRGEVREVVGTWEGGNRELGTGNRDSSWPPGSRFPVPGSRSQMTTLIAPEKIRFSHKAEYTAFRAVIGALGTLNWERAGNLGARI